MQQQHPAFLLPTTQGELLRHVRGSLTQAEFAGRLGVERSCLSRYEREKLGVPIKVLNHCLSAITAQLNARLEPQREIEQALIHARRTVRLLEKSNINAPDSAF